MKLLLVEDELRLAEALSGLLKLEHYEVNCASDGEAGLDGMLSDLYDGVILDVMLPKKNGFAVLQEARAAGIKTPVLLLTAKSELDDKVQGLDSGADDYLTKPFETPELLARVRALCRRGTGSMVDGGLAYGDLRLNPESATISCEATGKSVQLSAKEYSLLEYFFANQGRILTREQLALRIWGYESEAEYNNVEVYLSFTRKKIGFVGSAVAIKAVRGMGYRLQVDHV